MEFVKDQIFVSVIQDGMEPVVIQVLLKYDYYDACICHWPLCINCEG